MGNRLQDKIALISGAGSVGPGLGNGRAMALLFVREGARTTCDFPHVVLVSGLTKAGPMRRRSRGFRGAP